MTTARKVALAGITSPIDPTGVATEGFISGGNRVEVVVGITATSALNVAVASLAVVQMVVSVAASSSMDVVVAPATGIVQVVVSVDAQSSMDTSITSRAVPRARQVPRGGGGWPSQLYPAIEQAARAFAIRSFDAPESIHEDAGLFDVELSTARGVARVVETDAVPSWPAPAEQAEGKALVLELHGARDKRPERDVDLDAQIEAAERRKAEKLRQMEAEEMEIEALREQIAEVKREEEGRLTGMLKTAVKAAAVYSAVRVAIWMVAP